MAVQDEHPTPGDVLTDLTGARIGRYLIGRRLGGGGMAVVYQAYDQVLGRSVALKVLAAGADPATRSRFQQEARLAGSLRHPHIVATLQVGDAPVDGVAYIAMELVEGESLARLLDRRGQLLPQESCSLLTPIAWALAHAHERGVVHRDVKPSNILLRPASPGAPGGVQLEALDHPITPLLSDFGIARALDMPELTSMGRTVGTPAYMAPEQCAGRRDVDARADIYSLGAVLYRCLVGHAPFTGSTTQILHAHVYEPVTIPDPILAQLPPLVTEILQRTLAKDPVARYASARDLAQALAAAAGRHPPASSAPQPEDEATSTLTLASIPVPPPPPTQTVLVPSARGQSKAAAPALPTRAQALARPEESRPGPGPRPWRAWVPAGLGLVTLAALIAVLALAGQAWRRTAPTPARPAPAIVVGEPTAQPTQPAPTTMAAQPPGPAAEEPTQQPATQQPTPAPTAQPTQTPAPQPTAPAALEPEPAPSPTAPPAPTPEPTPAPSPTPEEALVAACQYVIAPEFTDALQDQTLAGELGCPDNVGQPVDFEVQPFQNGLMLRRKDQRVIYVRYASTGEWEQHPDLWQEGMPEVVEDPQLAPPGPGLLQPTRGMGKLWAENEQLRNTLGWATAPAKETRGLVQSFDGGLLLRDMEVPPDEIALYVFLKSKLRF